MARIALRILTLAGVLAVVTVYNTAWAGWTYTTIASTQSPANGVSGLLGNPVINNNGEVAFVGEAPCQTQTTVCDEVLTWSASSGLTKVFVAPYVSFGSTTTAQLDSVTLNDSGQIAFHTQVSTGLNVTDTILRSNGQTVLPLLPKETTNITIGPSFYNSPAILSNGRAVVFHEPLTEPVYFGYVTEGTSRPEALNQRYCFQQLSGEIQAPSEGPSVSAAGLLPFFARLPGDLGCAKASPQLGLFVSNAMTLETTLYAGFGDMNSSSPYGTPYDNYMINNSGTVVFAAKTLPGYFNYTEGVFLVDNTGTVSGPIATIDEGSCSSGGGSCPYSSYSGGLAINDSNTVVAGVYNYVPGTVPANTAGVVLNGDFQQPIALPFQTINGCFVNSASIGPHAINNSGQVVMLMTCGYTEVLYSMVVLATPST
jgi:hypothetical protein